MKSNKLVAGAAIAVGVLLLQSPAFSQYDGQTMPGVGCHRVSGGTLTRWFGTILNEHDTSTLNVMCPLVVTHQLAPGPEWRLYMAAAQVTDRHSTESTSCTRSSEYMTGSTYVFDDEELSTTGSSGTLKNLAFLAPSDPIFSQHYIKCSVPPRQNGNASHVISMQYVSVETE